MAENYPVIVGVGQLTNRSERVEDAIEPAEMMERAARAAEGDAGVAGFRVPGRLCGPGCLAEDRPFVPQGDNDVLDLWSYSSLRSRSRKG